MWTMWCGLLQIQSVTYTTTKTDAWILDSISRLCSKLRRTIFFWNYTWSKLKFHKAGYSKRYWQKELERWVTHKVNPQVPREDKSCREEKKTFICQQERRGKWDHPSQRGGTQVPSSTWTRPRSKRMRTDSSDRLGFAANNLSGNKRGWHRTKEKWLTALNSCDTSQTPSHRCRLFSSQSFFHTGATPRCPVSSLWVLLPGEKQKQIRQKTDRSAFWSSGGVYAPLQITFAHLFH